VATTVIGTAGFALCELLIAPLASTRRSPRCSSSAGSASRPGRRTANSLIQLAAPDHLRGRLIGLYFFAFAGTGTAGGILMGWLTAAGGTELGFAVAGIAGSRRSPRYVWLPLASGPLVEEQPA
jgi:MFS family permease